MHDTIPQLPPIRVEANRIDDNDYTLELVVGAHRFRLAKHKFKTIDEAQNVLAVLMKDPYVHQICTMGVQ